MLAETFLVTGSPSLLRPSWITPAQKTLSTLLGSGAGRSTAHAPGPFTSSLAPGPGQHQYLGRLTSRMCSRYLITSFHGGSFCRGLFSRFLVSPAIVSPF